MLVKWRPGFAIDNGIVDDDHKEIIGNLNSIIAALVSGTNAGKLVVMIDGLHELAARHFEREEHLQELLDFPDSVAHKAEHLELLECLDRIRKSLREIAPNLGPENPGHIKAVLYKWILSHIVQSDLKMQPYLYVAAA
jgi:hemerythrin-like metal-binding protein